MSLDVLLSSEGAREAVMAALAVPAPLGKLLIQYIGLFRPGKSTLSFDRVARLLNELLPMIQAGSIERGGITWSAPQPYWREGFEEMLQKRDKLTLPLKSHGYLLEIIAGISSKVTNKAEEKREQQQQSRPPSGGMITTHKNEETAEKTAIMSPEKKEEILRALRNFGKPAPTKTPSKDEQIRAINLVMAQDMTKHSTENNVMEKTE